MKILFVCLGNICRSPIAEGVMKKICKTNGSKWLIDSAGTQNYHIGEAPHIHSQAVCKEKGIDISQQIARQIQDEDLIKFDMIYALATDVYEILQNKFKDNKNNNKIKLFLQEQHPESYESVTDPWYGNKDGYYPVYDIIAECCNIIWEKYK